MNRVAKFYSVIFQRNHVLEVLRAQPKLYGIRHQAKIVQNLVGRARCRDGSPIEDERVPFALTRPPPVRRKAMETVRRFARQSWSTRSSAYDAASPPHPAFSAPGQRRINVATQIFNGTKRSWGIGSVRGWKADPKTDTIFARFGRGVEEI